MIILLFVIAYLGLGFVFSIPFLTRWIYSIDESTKDTSWGFRLTILPGTIVFWPILFTKYLKTKTND